MNKNAKKAYDADLLRYSHNPPKYVKRFLFLYRELFYCKSKIKKYIYEQFYKRLRAKRMIEIPYETQIGFGLYLGHFYSVTINKQVILGNNVSIHKNVTIGQENRGARKGCPTIGDNVWIGINAVIVGNIHIGNDVLIAPNAFVNIDVPDHSVVFGNPCIIKRKDNATKDYIDNIFTL